MVCRCKNINKEEKYIFIHIGKCGGKTIEKVFFSNRPGGTDVACYRDWKDKLGKNISSYTIFSIVRNPWDRVVSAFTRNTLPDRKQRSFAERGFKDVVFAKEFPLFASKEHPVHTAVDFLKNNNGDIIIDYIGRFEEFEKSFNEINKLLDKTEKIEHINPSYQDRIHSRYRDYYDDETKEFVEENFKEDIEYFNYSF